MGERGQATDIAQKIAYRPTVLGQDCISSRAYEGKLGVIEMYKIQYNSNLVRNYF